MRLDLVVFFIYVVVLATSAQYSISVLDKGNKPALSIANPVGSGHSPCQYTFNPGWIPTPDNAAKALVIVRAAGCPANFGGEGDHLMLATCYTDGTCDDLQPIVLPFPEKSAQDPRVVLWKGWYYLFYYASGSGQSTVYLRRTQTPENVTSWEYRGNYAWHRNGCMLLRETGPHYCIFGEAPPLQGIGIASTEDIENFEVLIPKFLLPLGANNTREPEIVLEASTPVVQLSTGDYLHIYSAGTPGWVANGNYTGGWIILDAQDPTKIKQRSEEHLLISSEPWEIGLPPYPVQRKRTIFATSLVPTGVKDQFRVWYGAADANVASAVIHVTLQ